MYAVKVSQQLLTAFAYVSIHLQRNISLSPLLTHAYFTVIYNQGWERLPVTNSAYSRVNVTVVKFHSRFKHAGLALQFEYKKILNLSYVYASKEKLLLTMKRAKYALSPCMLHNPLTGRNHLMICQLYSLLITHFRQRAVHQASQVFVISIL